MLFTEGRSSLVRLADSIKSSLHNALRTAEAFLVFFKKHSDHLSRFQTAAREQIKRNAFDDDSMDALSELARLIPTEDAHAVVELQKRLHAEVLSTILLSCFTLESYINSLGFFLIKERDLLGLVSNSGESTCDTFLAAIDRMSTVVKWQTIGTLKHPAGFTPASPPYQDLKILFNFRNDHVHDKVVDWDDNRVSKRYNNKLPDPFGGILDLSHAVYACDTYWDMVRKVHELVGVSKEEFHRHYNLSPWYDSDFEDQVKRISRELTRTAKG